MSFRPAGDEDSDSDDDGFYLGSNYSVKTDRDTVNNGINANKSVSPPETFTAMPAGAELDEVYNEDFERSTTPKISVPSTSSPIDGRKAQKKANKTSDGISSSRQTSGVSGPGRGQIQPRGRGRGGFPKPPPSSGNRGKSTRRANVPPSNKSKQEDARKAALSLAVDDLRVAIQKGNIDAVKKYLDDGIDPDVSLKSGWTSLMLAASMASSDLVELLISRGANVNFQKEMYTVLMATCAASTSVPEEQVFQCVELLLEKNARVNVYDKYRMSPLMYAAREGRVTICEKLLEHGAEINKQEMRGWTSLSFAASRGHGKVVRTLLDHGADPKISTNDGQTASDIAYSSDYSRLSDIIALAASGKQATGADVTSDATEPTSGHSLEDSSHTYGNLEMFLMGLDLKHLMPKFQEHKVTFDGLLSLTEKELDQMGITQVGVRTKILDGIREVHKKEWEVPKLHTMEKHSLSAEEVTVILANVSRHLTYLRSSVSFVNKHLNTVKEPLEFVQDVTAAEGMSLYCREASEASQRLNEELHSVKTQISQINSRVSTTAPDLIVEPKPQSAQQSSRAGVALVLGTTTIALGAFLVHRLWNNT